jgi:hypothetical protein
LRRLRSAIIRRSSAFHRMIARTAQPDHASVVALQPVDDFGMFQTEKQAHIPAVPAKEIGGHHHAERMLFARYGAEDRTTSH